MKNIYVQALCLCLWGGLTVSCADFLEENPKNSMSSGQYFTKPDHARSVVNQLYRDGVTSFYDAPSAYAGPTMMLGGYLSGLFDNEYKGQEVVVQYSHALTLTAQNISGSIDAVWENCYKAIGRANTAIKYIATTPELGDAERKTLTAQAKFFRAYNYFHLVKFFGDVPLILEPYESLTGLYVPRTETSKIYEQIEKDLKDASAEGALNDKAFTDNGYRVTKGAAETLLATVYLQMSGYPLQSNRYADAAACAKKVINGGKHILIPNGATPETSAYNVIRTADASKEYIYTREYTVGISDSGWRSAYSFPNACAAWGIFKYSITNNVYGITDVIVNAYNPAKDLRIAEKQFFFTQYSRTYIDKEGNSQVKTLDYKEDGKTRYSNWMFYDETALFESGKGGKDVAVFRYPEVLLIAAEALVKAGNAVTSEAAGYLAQVRARAYQQTDYSAMQAELASLPVNQFVEEVWAERIREFPLENKIWDDIQRTRQYPVTSPANRGTVTFTNVAGAKNPWGATFQEKHLLWPISNNEMQRNPKLTQNPGY